MIAEQSRKENLRAVSVPRGNSLRAVTERGLLDTGLLGIGEPNKVAE